MSVKYSNDTIGNRTCELPVCSVVPQPSALLYPTQYSGICYVYPDVIISPQRLHIKVASEEDMDIEYCRERVPNRRFQILSAPSRVTVTKSAATL
jgi:hypothetical protein